MKFEELNLAYQRVVETEAKVVVDAYKMSTTYKEWAEQNEKALVLKYCDFFANKYSDHELREKLSKERQDTKVTRAERAETVKELAARIDKKESFYYPNLIQEKTQQRSL